MDITNLTNLSNVLRTNVVTPKASEGIPGSEGGQGPSVEGFSDILSKSLEKVNEAQLNADKAVESFAMGKTKNIHETLLALESADVSLRMMVTVRNKAIAAYQEVMRMTV